MIYKCYLETDTFLAKVNGHRKHVILKNYHFKKKLVYSFIETFFLLKVAAKAVVRNLIISYFKYFFHSYLIIFVGNLVAAVA